MCLRIDVAEDDAVRLQRYCLIQRGGAALHRALTVEDAQVPADRLCRFLCSVAGALWSTISLV